MQAFISILLTTRALRTAALITSCLGFVMMAPAYGQSSNAQKTRLDATIFASQASPAYSSVLQSETLVTGTELIVDGGFETGSGPDAYGFSSLSNAWHWSYTGTMGGPTPRYTSSSTGAAHSGSWCVYFDPGFTIGTTTDRLYQTVSIPSGSATLSFYLKIGTFSGSSLDMLKVSFWNSTGTSLLGNVAAYTDMDSASYSYVKHTFDVSAYAGQTVRLQFDTSEYGGTIFLLDDVSLVSASTGSAACTEDAFTMCLVNGRYKVTSHWKNQYSTTPVVANLAKTKLTDKTGAFWIADADTYEYLIRFNTATNNGKIWLNVTTFTSVEFWVEVTDTVNGRAKEYHNAPGDTTMIWDPNTFVYP